jgi:uncharacterized protein
VDGKRVSELRLLTGRYAVCRLAADAGAPEWAVGPFVSVTRTHDELSVVCPEGLVPEGTKCDSGWRVLQVAGPLEFSLTGVLAAIATPLANAGIGIFAIATFDTDYVLLKEENLARATEALHGAGHGVG